nr:TetR/AcrR family transcriptional regulator [Galbitalea soli]
MVAAASELLLSPQRIELPSLRAVARACGVSPAAVYLHFASQGALIRAVIDSQLLALTAHVQEKLAATPAGGLGALAEAVAEWGFLHPGGYQLLFESADELGIDDHDDESRWGLIRAVESFLTDAGLSAADARPAAFRLWASIHGVISLRLHKPDLDWPTEWQADIQAIVASARRAKSG